MKYHLIQTISECCVHLGLVNKSKDLIMYPKNYLRQLSNI